MKLKALLTYSLVGVLVVLTGIFLYDYAVQNKISRVEAIKDLSYLDYDISKRSALDYLYILTIHDQESYSKVKDRVYDIVADNIKDKVFPTDEYNGVESPRPDLTIKTVKCDMRNKDQGVYLFKVDIELKFGSVLHSDAVMLVTTQNGLVTKAERI